MSTYTGAGVPPAEVYFADDFDPSTLKVPQLRGILGEHEVYPASTAKKGDLIELFENEVKPKASKYLKKAAKVKPSKEGITRIGNDGNVIDSPDKVAPSTTTNKRTRAKRSSATPARSTEQAEADVESDGDMEEGSVIQINNAPRRQSRRLSTTPSAEPTPIPTSSRKGKSRASSAGLTKSVSEPTGLATAGKLRKQPSVPVLREESEPESDGGEGLRKVGKKEKDSTAPETARTKAARRSMGDESGFSDYNPFQSGNEGSATPGEKRKKKSMGRKSESALGSSSASGFVKKSYTTQDLQAFRDPESSPNNSPAQTPVSAPAKTSMAGGSGSKESPLKVSPLKRFQPAEDSLKSPPKPWVEQRLAERKSREDLRGEAEGFEERNREIQAKMNQITSSEEQEEAREQVQMDVVEYEPEVVEEKQVVKREHPVKVLERPRKRYLTLPVMVFIVALLGGTYDYKLNSQAIGYCDTASSTNSIIQNAREDRERYLVCADERQAKRLALREHEEYNIDDIPSCEGGNLIPFIPRPDTCTPCPVQGECIGGDFLACAADHIPTQSILAGIFGSHLDGLPFLGPRAFPVECVRDMEKNRLMLQFAQKMEGELAVGRGALICSGADKERRRAARKAKDGLEGLEELKEAEVYGERKDDLKARFLELKNEHMQRKQFDEIFEDALVDLLKHKEVVEYTDEFGNTYFAATRAVIPLGCRAKLAVTQKFEENLYTILSGVLSSMLLAYLKRRWSSRSAESAKVKELVQVALERLQDQQHRHYIDPSLAPEPFIAPNQLRDYVLSHEHKPATRNSLWKKVQPIIEGNANVSVSEKELADGAAWKVWQWVGVSKEERHVTWQENMYPPSR